MIDCENEYGRDGYDTINQYIINQHIESEVSRRTTALKADYDKLQQKYDKLDDIHDSCYKNAAVLKEDYDKLKQDYKKRSDEFNNYYQAYIFSDYSST